MVALPEHDHCKNCGDPVPFDMAFCCEDCYWKYQATTKKEREKNMLFYGVAIASIIAIVAFGYIF